MWAKLTNSNPIDWCQYVCVPTFPPYSEVGALLPLTSSTLVPVIGWQAISSKKCLESMKETTVLQNHTHASQQKFLKFLGMQNLCPLSRFHIFTHTPVGIPAVYVQLEFQLCPYCNITLNPVVELGLTDHRRWFWTLCTWTCRARLGQCSMWRVFSSGYRLLAIMYDIILDFSGITHERLWYVLWYYWPMIS